jgi:hypothetical protein
MYRLLVGPVGSAVLSPTPGAHGAHRRLRIYGRFDCPSALRWSTCGHYARHRMFFAGTGRAAGYRSGAVCLPDNYTRSETTRRGRADHSALWR